MPTSANAPGWMLGSCSSRRAASPNAPPSSAPIASAGAKSPALPPVPMVSDDAKSFARHSPPNSATAAHPPGRNEAPLIASWTAP